VIYGGVKKLPYIPPKVRERVEGKLTVIMGSGDVPNRVYYSLTPEDARKAIAYWESQLGHDCQYSYTAGHLYGEGEKAPKIPKSSVLAQILAD
jgi:hypothetical protein